jgi:hypothetical protein
MERRQNTVAKALLIANATLGVFDYFLRHGLRAVAFVFAQTEGAAHLGISVRHHCDGLGLESPILVESIYGHVRSPHHPEVAHSRHNDLKRRGNIQTLNQK